MSEEWHENQKGEKCAVFVTSSYEPENSVKVGELNLQSFEMV